VLVVGANGSGKTNLLEALHVGTQGFSPRTRAESQLIRIGADGGRVVVEGMRGGASLRIEVKLRRGDGKQARLNGRPLRAAEQLRNEISTLVFTPDRLAVVKGPPALRRAYVDRALGRLRPSQARLPAEYGAAVAQRNAALRRIAAGFSNREALVPWTDRVTELGRQLVEARIGLLEELGPLLRARSAELELGTLQVAYPEAAPSTAELEARLDRDLERGSTGLGPHLHDVAVLTGDRDLRSFGSQGEQRLAVLALLLAEAELLRDRGTPPLLLFDDVLSELDARRRSALLERIRSHGQSVVTATAASLLPGRPDQLLEIAGGAVRRA
jgi:DNA replication and repair protein RecF